MASEHKCNECERIATFGSPLCNASKCNDHKSFTMVHISTLPTRNDNEIFFVHCKYCDDALLNKDIVDGKYCTCMYNYVDLSAIIRNTDTLYYGDIDVTSLNMVTDSDLDLYPFDWSEESCMSKKYNDINAVFNYIDGHILRSCTISRYGVVPL
jgi:hypothetical protein